MIPSLFDGWRLDFSLSHTLDCHKGGLITQCNNEVREAMGDLETLTYN